MNIKTDEISEERNENENNYLNYKNFNNLNNKSNYITSGNESYFDGKKQLDINFKKNHFPKINNVQYDTETLTQVTYEEYDSNKTNIFKKIIDNLIFPLLGITCFINMNAFISSLDCFQFYQKNFYPESFFNNIFFFSSALIQIILSCIDVNQKTWSLLKLSLLIPLICLVIFLILIINFNNIYVYVILCFLILINGVFSGLYLYLMNGILPFIEFKNLILIITGQAISSVIISIIRLTTYFIFKQSSKEDLVFYSLTITFVITSFIIFFTFITLYNLKNRKDFYICFSELEKKHKTAIFESEVLIRNNNDVENNQDYINNENKTDHITKNSQYELMKIAFNKNKFFFMNVFFFGLLTYLFHPNIFINMKLFGIGSDLSIILTIIFFNVFDSIGRLSTNIVYIKTKKRIYLLTYLRIYFAIVFSLAAYWINHTNSNNYSYNQFLDGIKIVFTNNVFLCIHIALFSFSFGFLNCNSFIYLGGIRDQIIQFKSNMIASICIGGGIFVGSSLSSVLALSF